MSYRPSYDEDVAVVIGILRRVCDASLPEITPETRLDEVPGMDSLRVLHVIAGLESHYRIEIDIGELDVMEHVQDVVRAVHAALRARADSPGTG